MGVRAIFLEHSDVAGFRGGPYQLLTHPSKLHFHAGRKV